MGEIITVTASVCVIVAISVAIGNALPLGMRRVGIQVIMDILGVAITVCVSSFVLRLKYFRTNKITHISCITRSIDNSCALR